MARRVRNTHLETPSGRLSLKIRTKPFCRLETWLHLGYRRRANGGSWIGRRFTESGRYVESKLALADDSQGADGNKTLNYDQAQKAAREWHNRESRVQAGLEEAHSGPGTVAML